MATTIQNASGFEFIDDRYPITGMLLNLRQWKEQANQTFTEKPSSVYWY